MMRQRFSVLKWMFRSNPLCHFLGVFSLSYAISSQERLNLSKILPWELGRKNCQEKNQKLRKHTELGRCFARGSLMTLLIAKPKEEIPLFLHFATNFWYCTRTIFIRHPLLHILLSSWIHSTPLHSRLKSTKNFFSTYSSIAIVKPVYYLFNFSIWILHRCHSNRLRWTFTSWILGCITRILNIVILRY